MKSHVQRFGPARQGRTNFENRMNFGLISLQKVFKLGSKLHLSDKFLAPAAGIYRSKDSELHLIDTNFGACGGLFFTGWGLGVSAHGDR